MLVARTSCLVCYRMNVHYLVKRYNQTGNTIDALRSGDFGQRRRDRTFKLLSLIYASGSRRQLYLSDASTFHARRTDTKLETRDFMCVILDFDPIVIYGTTFQRHDIAPVFQLYSSTEN